MASLGTLAVNIVARTDKFAKGITKSLGLTHRLRSGLGTAAIATTAFAASTVAAGATVVRTYENINSALNKSLAIMGDVSEAQRRQMLSTALEVAKTTQKSTAQAAESYFFLASAGLDAAQSLKAMPVVAKFAQAGNFDLALATDLATDAQSALGLSSKDTAEGIKGLTRVTNVLIKANTLANASAQQFSEAVTNGAGASMRAANIEIEQGVAVLAAYADQGIKGAEAGTAFGIVLRDLQTKALQNKAAFAAAGVSVFDATGKMQNMADIVGDLESLLGPLSVAQRKSTLMALGFSDKSVKYLQALSGTSEKIREYEAGLKGSNAAAEVAGKSMTDLEKTVARMSAAWDTLALKIGGAAERMGAFESASEFMEGLGIILDQVSEADRLANGGRKPKGGTSDDVNSDGFFNMSWQKKLWSDAIMSMVPDETSAVSAEHNARFGEMRNEAQQKALEATIAAEEKAAEQAKKSEQLAAAFDKYFYGPINKLSSTARVAGIEGVNALDGIVSVAKKGERAAKAAMAQDALYSATFGLFGKKANKASQSAELAASTLGPRAEQTARVAGSVDTYSAARRNLRSGETKDISQIRKNSDSQVGFLRELVAIAKAGGGADSMFDAFPIDGGAAT